MSLSACTSLQGGMAVVAESERCTATRQCPRLRKRRTCSTRHFMPPVTLWWGLQRNQQKNLAALRRLLIHHPAVHAA